MATVGARAAALGLIGAVALGGCTRAAPPTPSASGPPSSLTVTSDAFTDGTPIPTRYTCQGQRQAPALTWSGDSRGADAFAVVVDDPDAPSGDFFHWVVLDIPETVWQLTPGALPLGAHQAKNSATTIGWTPPCPPSGTHHYRFTVYGLKATTGLPDGVAPDAAVKAVQAAAVAQGRLVGTVTHQ
jgi:Raf kinase inhibitor-like YbhB/YbcL family protein